MKRGKYIKLFKVDLLDLSTRSIVSLVEEECSAEISIGLKNKDRVVEHALRAFLEADIKVEGETIVLFPNPPKISPEDLSKMSMFSGAQIIKFVKDLTGVSISLSPKSRSSVLKHAVKILSSYES
jgi:hypothetical protein